MAPGPWPAHMPSLSLEFDQLNFESTLWNAYPSLDLISLFYEEYDEPYGSSALLHSPRTHPWNFLAQDSPSGATLSGNTWNDPPTCPMWSLTGCMQVFPWDMRVDFCQKVGGFVPPGSFRGTDPIIISKQAEEYSLDIVQQVCLFSIELFIQII